MFEDYIKRVTKEDERPLGKRGECFYCKRAVGQTHKDECVCLTRKITLEIKGNIEIDVPSFWDADLIEFHFNESSWCADNIIDELNKHIKSRGCLCDILQFRYINNV